MSKYPRGSEWRIWDLHVHTPESIEHNYAGPDPWDRYLTELSQLPADIKVIGVNDYWFLDGYERVRAAFDRGDLPNLEAVFPVLEVRCDTFGGTEGNLSRLNLHMICDPELSVATIKAQLQPLMKATYVLTIGDEPVVWSQFPTRDSLVDLGNKIIESAPPERRKSFPSPLKTGFNNLNVSFEGIRKGIAENSSLRSHVALALGKAEWADIKWSQQAVAQKKHLINSVAAVFTAAPTREAFTKSQTSLTDNGVLDRLLDCSDAHNWADSNQPGRLGACMTWVNADPTFKGLLQALQEYPDRVSVDERPPVLTRVARAPRTVIAEVALQPVDPSRTKTPLFSTSLPVNPGFTVVIGNKGQGKSALLDSIALAANSDRHEDFSFLSPERFRSGGGRIAREYEVEITWADGSTTGAQLDGPFDDSAAILVDYLPQSLIEKVCAADPDSAEKRHFEAEIERVLFRHIPAEDRGTSTTLNQHLLAQSSDLRTDLDEARSRVAVVVRELVELTTRQEVLHALGLEQRLADFQLQRKALADEIDQLDEAIATGGTEQQQETAQAVAAAIQERDAINARIVENQSQQLGLRTESARVGELVESLRSGLVEAHEQADEIAAAASIPKASFFQASFSEEAVASWQAAQRASATTLQVDLESAGGLLEKSRVAVRKVAELEAALTTTGDEVHRLHQRRVDVVAQVARVDGDPSDPQSISGVAVLVAELADAPSRVQALEDALEQAFLAVHGALSGIMDLQKGAYGPATEFIGDSKLAEGVGLAFDVEFRVRGFVDGWIGMVNRQKLGDFHDVDRRGKDRVVLADAALEDAAQLFASLNGLVERLGRERGGEKGGHRSLTSIMRASHTAADLLSAIYDLRWLESQYIIRSDGSELSELSPGQRGLVLLLFYLLVDTSERPLLLDQPEENLDNQTVRTSLVPAMREATSRRQVIAVTHNPNLAIVGDADQIIVASSHDGFKYACGSLADLPVGIAAINVLEGTRGAFASRELKYDQVVGH